MRKIRYQVAMSLDGYIAGPKGDYDWILADPEMDFAALFAQFDTALIGRKTFESMGSAGIDMMAGMKIYVFSRTLRQSDYPQVTMVADTSTKMMESVKAEPGKDIWLFGGGSLFHSLLDAGVVDTVEVAVEPVLLGGGIPLLPPPGKQTKLKLIEHKVYKTGIVSLQYEIE